MPVNDDLDPHPHGRRKRACPDGPVAHGRPALAQAPGPQAVQAPAADDPQSAPADQSRDTVVIFGRAEEQIGEAQSASEGVVGYADLSTRPISRAAELVEVIPGMIATEHSSGGKANQYFLRGFNLDHGTDFGGFIDGVPINQRSHPHMSGYLDLNFLMADLVERVEFKKGRAVRRERRLLLGGLRLLRPLRQTPRQLRPAPRSIRTNTASPPPAPGISATARLLAAASHEGGDGAFDLPADLNKNIALSEVQPAPLPWQHGRGETAPRLHRLHQ